MTVVEAPAVEAPRVGARVAAALRSLVYIALGVPLGSFYVGLLAAGLSLGLSLSVVWVGVPLLLALPLVAWRLARVERALANRLLHAHIAPLARRATRRSSLRRRAWDHVASADSWRALVLLLLKLPVSCAALALAAAPVALTLALLVLGIDGLSARDTERFLGPWHVGPPLGAALCALAVPAAIVSTALLCGLGALLAYGARLLLAPRTPTDGAVREALAERLGDRTLAVAYWLPDRAAFVDEHGHPVELPEPGTGRAWTAVEDDGRRVAAIIHDAELDASPDLVQAAASGAVLALANERLKADLRARLEELRASRARIVQAGDDARRRIERDLHDGAQQHLVALALDLQLLRRRVAGDDAASSLAASASDKLATALAELRELARGIHPAVLAERGLEPALQALAERAPLPVDCNVELDGRLPAAVEAAIYFVAAEALTNVAKYAGASEAAIDVRLRDGVVELEVRDDGAGGADPAAGSGLRGLEDRVAALDGTLTLQSPLGVGTRVRASIPCAGAP